MAFVTRFFLLQANLYQATEGDSRYIAPEIMQGNFSKAVDIFSLGIAMLELSCFLELPSNGKGIKLFHQEVLRIFLFSIQVLCGNS